MSWDEHDDERAALAWDLYRQGLDWPLVARVAGYPNQRTARTRALCAVPLTERDAQWWEAVGLPPGTVDLLSPDAPRPPEPESHEGSLW